VTQRALSKAVRTTRQAHGEVRRAAVTIAAKGVDAALGVDLTRAGKGKEQIG